MTAEFFTKWKFHSQKRIFNFAYWSKTIYYSPIWKRNTNLQFSNQKGLRHKMTQGKVWDVLIKSWIFESCKWPPVATFKSWNINSALSFFNFLLFTILYKGYGQWHFSWLKVSQFRKQIFLFSFKPKNQRKTCFWTWSIRKSKKLGALLIVQLLKVATGDHFQDSKFRI